MAISPLSLGPLAGYPAGLGLNWSRVSRCRSNGIDSSVLQRNTVDATRAEKSGLIEINSQPMVWKPNMTAVMSPATRATRVRTMILRFRLALMIEFTG